MLKVSSFQGIALELAITYDQPAPEDYFMTLSRRDQGHDETVRFTIRTVLRRRAHTDRAKRAVNRLLGSMSEIDWQSILAEEFVAAMQHPNFDSVAFLVDELSVNIGQVDMGGCTIMHMSLHYDCFDFFEPGLQAGLEFDVPDAQGCSPIHHAAAGNCADGMDWLLSNSVDPECIDNMGWTLLHYAAAQGHHEMVHRLLAAGNSIETVESQGRTPLEVASTLRPSDTSLLKQLGASQQEAHALSATANYSICEVEWHLLCFRAMPFIRELTDLPWEQRFDLQRDWDWARILALTCDYNEGQGGNCSNAQLTSASNKAIYAASVERVVENADLQATLSADISSSLTPPGLCACCGYVSQLPREPNAVYG